MRVLRLTLPCVVATILAPVSSLARSPRPPLNIAQNSRSLQENVPSAEQSHNLTVRQNGVQCGTAYNVVCSSIDLCCGATCCNTDEICSYYVCIPAYGDVTTDPANTSPTAEPTETPYYSYPLGETTEVDSATTTEAPASTSARSLSSVRTTPAETIASQPSETGTASKDSEVNEKKGLSQSDKIALGVGLGTGVPSLIVGIFACIWARKALDKKKNKKKKNTGRSEYGSTVASSQW